MAFSTAKILFLIVCISFVIADQPYQRVIHSTDPEALCLDGSPPVLYYHEGSEKNKFLVFFIGGGFCSGMTLDQAIADCYARSKTQLGSSKGWPETLNGDGYLSTNSTTSSFANWTKIVFGYCDGSLHQGNRKTPITYRGQKIYHRGAVITRSHFKWIMNKYPNFKSADQIIVTGSSAGGIATYLWTNYVRTLVNNASVVLSIPDSGVFLFTKTFKTDIDFLQIVTQNMFKMANIDQKSPLDLCNSRYKGQEFKCLFIQYAFTSFQARTLLVGSEYDSWVINNALKIKCLTKGKTQYSLANCTQEQRDFIEGYRTKFKNFMQLYHMNSKNSVWSIGCSQHGYSFTKEYFDSQTERVPVTTGYKIRQAIQAFVFKGERISASQEKPWPSNTGCAF